ncbi:type I-C CRISPR-associated protein Cas8c/Csd1 [Nocardia camponoti]|uniref:CRISPR-associated Csd1 family protein n=1 Tax=Nocardia camponoti TaxID=1616106 RepID=A0A917V7K7_9NOCA|nr:type I-C CRISPR-associated protein Cas8c/Csd1 [Nocardia camponoti]GGK49214.1 CRISPR-associated Csd1 family protein [Nocardia camponoti]
MLLTRLVEQAAINGDSPAFFGERRYRHLLDVRTREGVIVSVVLTRAGDSGAGVVHTTPTSDRTVNVLAHLGADDAQYVLGRTEDPAKVARAARCHAEFVELIRRWAQSVEHAVDPVPHLLVELYRSSWLSGIDMTEVNGKDGVLLVVDGVPAYQSPTAATFWAADVAARKSTGAPGVCLVCGQVRDLARNIPVKVPQSLVPGATNEATLVSVNARVFGYDLTEHQLAYTPICLTCADRAMAGLKSVLSSEHSLTYSGQDTRLAWWVSNPDETSYAGELRDPNPDRVLKLMNSVHQGKPTRTRANTRFCWMAVSGNVSRVMVRQWVDMALASESPEAASHDRNIADWFEDHRIAPRFPNPKIKSDGTLIEAGRQWHPLGAFARVLGRWDNSTNRYAEFGVKNADRFDKALIELTQAALMGSPISIGMRTHLLHRIRNDGRVDDVRASLIKLALNRSPQHAQEKPMSPGLDLERRDPAYLAGRLFALLEDTQRAAHSTWTPPDAEATSSTTEQDTDTQDRDGVNSTFANRYFRSAVAAPRVALVQGRIEADAWISKIKRRKKPAIAYYYANRLTALYNVVDAAEELPARNNLRQQEQFILGYHHQRAFRPTPRTTTQSTD